jgi:hypothetical protein
MKYSLTPHTQLPSSSRPPPPPHSYTQAGLAVVRGRVLGETSTLAMTRALGDVKYKQPHLPPQDQAVSPVPDTTSVQVGVVGGGRQLWWGWERLVAVCGDVQEG